jgi:hypothetical protein
LRPPCPRKKSQRSLNCGSWASIALAPDLFLDGFDAAIAAVQDDPHRLATNPGKVVQTLCEQHRTQIGDVPPAGFTWTNQAVFLERGQNACTALGERDIEQVEIARVIEKAEHLRVTRLFAVS